MDTRISKLNEASAQQLLENYVAFMADKHGLVVLATYDRLRTAGALDNPWVNGDGEFQDRDHALRNVIDQLLTNGDSDTRSWMDSALTEFQNVGSAESVVAAVLGGMAILGITSVALVLAARVKSLGTAEFYEGVPSEVVEMVETVKMEVPAIPTTE